MESLRISIIILLHITLSFSQSFGQYPQYPYWPNQIGFPFWPNPLFPYVPSDVIKVCSIPDGYVSYGSYKIYSTPKNFTQAIQICANQNGYLAFANSYPERDLLTSFKKENNFKNLWLGIYREPDDSTRTWYTMKNDPVKYFYWGANQPDNSPNNKGKQYCMRSMENDMMDDIDCHALYPFVCKSNC